MDCDDEPAALFLQGNDLLDRGDAQGAIAALPRCHALRPEHASILFNLANAQLAAGRLPDAVDNLVACLRRAPDFAPAYVSLADSLRRLTLLALAQQMAEAGVLLLPRQPLALITLANILHERADYTGALQRYRQVLEIDPHDAGALTNLGNTFRAMGRLQEALAEHDKAVAAAPENAEIRFNRALSHLMAGDYARGWEDYEFRWLRPCMPPRDLGPVWDGGSPAGRTVLLYTEQGLGDTLQFIRYAPLVAERGADVVLEVPPELLRLLRHAMPFAKVVARGDTLPHYDACCPLLSLPRVFGTRIGTIPAALPYLRADPELAASWRGRLPEHGLRVGLVWAGGAHMDDAGAHMIDQRRSLRTADIVPLAEIPGVHWVSLQMGRPEQPIPMPDVMGQVADFADTAAIVANLDLVVSVDTSVAHLAAAMACPVWLLSRYDGCWRWLHDRDDSPWYPGMRIYRQDRPLDWSGPLHRLRSDLEAWTARRIRAASPGGS